VKSNVHLTPAEIEQLLGLADTLSARSLPAASPPAR
jgi:hypothetical protein